MSELMKIRVPMEVEVKWKKSSVATGIPGANAAHAAVIQDIEVTPIMDGVAADLVYDHAKVPNIYDSLPEEIREEVYEQIQTWEGENAPS